MLSSNIEWMPGAHRGRVTHSRVVRLCGDAPQLPMPVAGRPGSLKRAALEAMAAAAPPHRTAAGKRARRRRIDFQCAIPFRQVPPLVRDGFARLERLFGDGRGDRRVLEHYQAAQDCLALCLGDPACDVMLMLALTLGASSATPAVEPGRREFSAAPQRKEPALLAANMVTRMLWFLRPAAFPWDRDDGMVLRVPEMTKKIGRCLPLLFFPREVWADGTARAAPHRTQGCQQPRAPGAWMDQGAGCARQPAEQRLEPVPARGAPAAAGGTAVAEEGPRCIYRESLSQQ